MPRLNGSQSTRIFMWNRYPPAYFTRTPPVLDMWYPLVNLVGGVRLKYLYIYQANNELDDKDIEYEVLTDYIDMGDTKTFGSGEHTMLTEDALGKLSQVVTVQAADGVPAGLQAHDAIFCHTLSIRLRIVTACGTNQTLWYQALYDKWDQL